MRHVHRAWHVIFFAPDPTFSISWLIGVVIGFDISYRAISRQVDLRALLNFLVAMTDTGWARQLGAMLCEMLELSVASYDSTFL